MACSFCGFIEYSLIVWEEREKRCVVHMHMRSCGTADVSEFILAAGEPLSSDSTSAVPLSDLDSTDMRLAPASHRSLWTYRCCSGSEFWLSQYMSGSNGGVAWACAVSQWNGDALHSSGGEGHMAFGRGRGISDVSLEGMYMCQGTGISQTSWWDKSSGTRCRLYWVEKYCMGRKECWTGWITDDIETIRTGGSSLTQQGSSWGGCVCMVWA